MSFYGRLLIRTPEFSPINIEYEVNMMKGQSDRILFIESFFLFL